MKSFEFDFGVDVQTGICILRPSLHETWARSDPKVARCFGIPPLASIRDQVENCLRLHRGGTRGAAAAVGERNSIRFRGSHLWNSIPDVTKSCDSVLSFKRQIREWSGSTCPVELVDVRLGYIVIGYFCKLCKLLIFINTHPLMCPIDLCYQL